MAKPKKPIPSRSKPPAPKPYKTWKSEAHRRRFEGQDEKTVDCIVILPVCPEFNRRMMDFANAMVMNPTEALWFAAFSVLQRMEAILQEYSPAQIRALSVEKYDLTQRKTKSLRATDAAKNRLKTLQTAFGLGTMTATFRFALAYCHQRLGQILLDGIDAAIRVDPQQAFAELESGEPLYIKTFPAITHLQRSAMALLTSGENLKKAVGPAFPGLSEKQIRDFLVQIVQTEVRNGLISAKAARDFQKRFVAWQKSNGMEAVRQRVSRFSKRWEEYAQRHFQSLIPANPELQKEIMGNLERLTKLLGADRHFDPSMDKMWQEYLEEHHMLPQSERKPSPPLPVSRRIFADY